MCRLCPQFTCCASAPSFRKAHPKRTVSAESVGLRITKDPLLRIASRCRDTACCVLRSPPMLIAERNRGVASGTLLGFASVTLATPLDFSWLVATVRAHRGFGRTAGSAVVFGFCVQHGGRFALFAVLASAMCRTGWPWLLTVGVAFAASEASCPMLFSLYFGTTLHRVSLLIRDIARTIHNATQMLSPNGDVLGRYAKRYRLPFDEYIQHGERFPKLYRWPPTVSSPC